MSLKLMYYNPSSMMEVVGCAVVLPADSGVVVLAALVLILILY